MSLRVPLSVRLSSALADRHVTRELRGLTFRGAAPNGYASATMSFNRPLSVAQDDIVEFARVYVYDMAGEVMWEGMLEDPSRNVNSDGEVYELAAIGGCSLASNWTGPLIYVDSNLQSWQQVDNFTAGATVQVGADPSTSDDTQAIVCQLPMGTSVATNGRGVAGYELIRAAGQKVAYLAFTWHAGRTTSAFNVRANVNTDNGSNTQVYTATATTSGASVTKTVVTDWTNGANVAQMLIHWPSGPVTLLEDTDWVAFRAVAVVAMRYDQTGAEITAGYGATVTTAGVVADLLGRILGKYHNTRTTVAASGYAIDQLAYPDGVTPETVLADMMALDNGYYWAVWESDSAGQYFFEWAAWGSTVRFETSPADGFTAPGSTADLFNQVRVRYRDPAGLIRTVLRTQSVQALTDAGIDRTGFIDLGDTVGSAANANQAGDQFLADHATQPNRGTLTVSRPMVDFARGRMLQPWELPRWAPGQLIRVRRVAPRPDSLNATARDGSTVFRIVAAEFDAETVSTKLELDSFPITVSRVMSALVRPPSIRRR